MNVYTLEGNWHRLAGKVQEQWGKFTHDESCQIEGNHKQLIGKIQELYGIGREEAERQFHEWEQHIAA